MPERGPACPLCEHTQRNIDQRLCPVTISHHPDFLETPFSALSIGSLLFFLCKTGVGDIDRDIASQR